MSMASHVMQEAIGGGAARRELDDRLDALAAATTGAGLLTRVTVSGRSRGLPPAVERAGYGIVQEALSNALRHAGPASIVVTMSSELDRLVVEVLDDGRGPAWSPAEIQTGCGNGIDGMRERARALGGQLFAGPWPLGGFRVRASLPVGVQS
jgi:signal transduction histidine kinase